MIILAYLDDVFIHGPQEDALKALDDFKSLSAIIGLLVADSKCEVFLPPSDSSLSSMPSTNVGTVVLGCPIGCSSFVSSHCISFVESGQLLCDKICQLGDAQCSMLLLRHCHVSRTNHLARSVPPAFLQPSKTKLMTPSRLFYNFNPSLNQNGVNVTCL